MTMYPYRHQIAFDPYTQTTAPGAGMIFAQSDVEHTTPLTPTDEYGVPLELVANTETGYLPPFYVEDHPAVRFVSDGWVTELVTTMPLVGPPGPEGPTTVLPPGEVEDVTVAPLITDTSSATRAALNAATSEIVVKGTGIVSTSAYGLDNPEGLAPGEVSARLQAAMDGTAAGATLRVRPDKYQVSGKLVRRPGDAGGVTLDLTGVHLDQMGNEAALMLWGAPDEVVSVTGIATAVTSAGYPMTTLTLSDATSWEPGDLIKVIADDVIPYGRPGSDGNESRIGEYMTVASMTGNVVTLVGRLFETYTTNIRAFRLSRKPVHIIGGTIAYPDVVNNQQMAVSLRGLVDPAIEGMTVKRCPSAGFNIAGCYGYKILESTVDYGVNDTSSGNFGYGIMDNQSAFGLVSGFKGRFVRTGFTDDSQRIAANSDPLGYGRSYRTKVVDSFAHGTAEGGFSTHANSRGMEFVNNTATDCGIGFRLRGVGHLMKKNHADGAMYALDIADENHGSRSFGHKVDGFTWERIKDTPVRAVFAQSGHPTPGVREQNPSYLTGLSGPMSANDQDAGLEFRNATIHVGTVHLTMPETGPYDWRPLQVQNSKVKIKSLTVDCTASTGANTIRLVNAIGDADLEVDYYRVINNTEQAARTTAIARTATDNVRLHDVRYDVMAATSVTGTGPEPLYDYVELTGTGRSSHSTVQGSSAGMGARGARTMRDSTITLQGSTQTFSNLLPGRRLGQVLTVTSDVNGTVTINQGGSTLIRAAAAISLARYQSVRFVWDGTVWVHAG